MEVRAQRNVVPRRKVVEEPGSHRPSDIAGVLLIALGIIAALSLIVSNVGAIGLAMGTVFKGLFGRGAWIVPLMLWTLGIGLVTGHRKFPISSTAWGLLVLLLAFLGIIASPGTAQDWFNPGSADVSGGYLGAVIGWASEGLLGAGRYVGLSCLAVVGAILCLNTPLASLLGSVKNGALQQRDRLKNREVKPRSVKTIVVPREAVVEAAAELREVEPRRPRGPVVIKDTAPVRAEWPPSLQGPEAKSGYQLPSMGLLTEPVAKPKRNQQEMQKNIETLEGTLEEFGIDANVVEIATGPTITRYEIQLGPGIRVARISALADNIAMNLAASQVRVEAPIPGKAAIGVEVPNSNPTMVCLREVCETKEFLEHRSRLCVALGQDVSGVNKYADLTTMPHLLIGGATNSGKSIGLATIITSLLMRNTPKDLRLVMIDPKRVELALFDDIPHLLCPVIRDVKEAPGVLRAVWREMDRRYDLFSSQKVRNIDGWNEKATYQDRMPYIVVIIDELADLMIQAAAEVETSICRLAQLARATGIHLVIATQRPSVDVITGTIKANIASRIAFTVSSQIDSRTILDQKGAESLIGRGDMLFMPIDANKAVRVQGCYVGEKEIEKICEFWRNQEKPCYVIDPMEYAAPEEGAERSRTGDEQSDSHYEDAVRFVADRGEASTSMLQRRFSIGFQRASRLLDHMEERGIVGKRDGPRPREVLITPSDADALFGGTPYGDTGWVGEK